MSQKGSIYHWLIVAACFMLTAVSIGILVNCFAILAPALVKEFDSTRGGVERVFMIAALMNLVGSALVGKIMSKFTMRLAMPVYAILMSAGIILWSMCDSLSQMYLVAILVGLGASGIAVIPCGALINNWFEEKKGLAIGLAFTGSGVGGVILVQLTTYMLANSNLQTTYLALGIVAAAISIPITLFVVREHPRDRGLMPYGSTGQASTTSQMALPGIALKQYIKTGSFWFLAIAVFIISFINVGLQNHFPAHLGKMGIAEADVTNIFSLYLILLVFGKILLGTIYDKAGIVFGSIYGLVAYIATIGLLFYTGNIYIAIVCAIVFSLAGSMTTVTPPYVTAKIVGLKDYATIFGILNLFYGIGLVVGPVVAANIYDKNGSYDNVFYAFGALSVILCLVTILSAKKGEGFDKVA